MINFHGTITGATRTKTEDPQRNPLPLPSLWLLQTIYRPILQIFGLLPRRLFLLFRGMRATTTSSPPALTYQGRRDEGKTYDLECVEV